MGHWKDWFIYFLFYSMIGWIYEVLLGIFVFKLGFVNRGFLFGPYCPVYGFGALLFIVLLQKRKDKKVMVGKVDIMPLITFLLIIAITTAVELLTSYAMELLMGEWLWDYREYAFNFEGRIAPETSLRFGIGGMVILYVLHPWLKRVISKINPKIYTVLAYLLMSAFGADLVSRLFLGSNYINT